MGVLCDGVDAGGGQVLCDNVLRAMQKTREELSSWSRTRRVTRQKRTREVESLLLDGACFTESGRKVGAPLGFRV